MKYVQISASACSGNDDHFLPKKVICEACLSYIMNNPEQHIISCEAAGTPAPDEKCQFKIADNCASR